MTKLSSRKLTASALVLAGACCINGCSPLAPQEDKSRYYVLSSTGSVSATGGPAQSGNPRFIVGIEPLMLPRYLQRPEILTRLSQSELSVSSTDRWGEPLNTGVARVLAEDLSMSLNSAEVVSFPWSKKTPVEYLIFVEFVKLEQTADRRVLTSANWIIRRGSDDAIVRRGTTSDDRPAGADQRSATEALSVGIGHVSNDIAEALEQDERKPSKAKLR